MAIYHLSVKPVSRSAGRSATAAAAYRAGAEITDERTGQTHDYTRKGGVESADLVLPDNAPVWASDRSALWNAAERAEKRKDACVAREYEVALPSELPPEERRRLAADFAREMANREDCAVDVCIHAPGRGGDGRNHHAHLLRTTRKVEAEGLGAKLDTEKAGRNRKQDLEAVRERWAALVNERLRQHGIEANIDHRSLEAQGIDREPSQHLGPAVSGLVRRDAGSEVATRMGEQFISRRVAADALGQIGRDLDRSILDLSGDLAGAIREREERQCEAERPPKGAERTGPAVNVARFNIQKRQAAERREAERREAEAVAREQARIDRERLAARPIEEQAKAFERMQKVIGAKRQERIVRIADQAGARLHRRKRAEQAARASEPQEPTGLLASFKRKAYEQARADHRSEVKLRQALTAQAATLAHRLSDAAQSHACLGWAYGRLREAEPAFTRRVEAHRAAEQARQKDERRRQAELNQGKDTGISR